MVKGYIYKNGDGDWQLGFLSNIGVEGEALYTTYGNYSTWGMAMGKLIEKQIKEG